MMNQEDAIGAAIRAFDPDTKANEIKWLQGISQFLDPDEIPEGCIRAWVQKDAGGLSGLLATNKRLLYTRNSFSFRQPNTGKLTGTSSYSYDTISSISFVAKQLLGLLGGDIGIESPGGSVTFSVRSRNARVKEFVDLIRAKMAAASAKGAEAPPPAASSDLLEKLERLSRLRDTGALTEEEFKHAKTLLGV